MIIRDYRVNDETGWVRCRTLAFLQTAYFDNVLNKKERYENPAIELVAELDGQIVGLIDVEYEIEERTVCSRGEGLGGMIWHIAVHPDFSRRGIGQQLLYAAENKARRANLNRFEAWTRDDLWVQKWYEKMNFNIVDSYYHVYFEENEMNHRIQSNMPNLYLVNAFTHYVGKDIDQFTNNKRIHQCVCFEKSF
ncbi:MULTISPECIES: GNAT family N-acetyltransferase [Lysinibacillus]|uniref:GNAT family N-acetyltransferase n=1 Tax=Lysinibacillus TaxID=400634 RepID=UPI00214BE539|nr:MULTISPECIES: GNAT family N-acetyltransferase [Lysinibacillus]UNT54082.1 GNAT family N-acetyltransferase [Lysinibacillus capsici]UUV26284.1 GNAT family N-acetyltransferase [Lysinibacillus sp. FN11]UYB49160.1 GNAT family N-acetyltransferase [Lysinibacillus capsici]